MAFRIHSVSDGHMPSTEYLPAGAITPKAGMALAQSSGLLAPATGTTAPVYISQMEADAALASGTLIPVVRVDHRTIYETTLQAAGTSLKLGDKVTLHTDGLQVTATTTGGVAEIVGMDDTAAGSKVLVRF